jgi:hypothetical protein
MHKYALNVHHYSPVNIPEHLFRFGEKTFPAVKCNIPRRHAVQEEKYCCSNESAL